MLEQYKREGRCQSAGAKILLHRPLFPPSILHSYPLSLLSSLTIPGAKQAGLFPFPACAEWGGERRTGGGREREEDVVRSGRKKKEWGG